MITSRIEPQNPATPPQAPGRNARPRTRRTVGTLVVGALAVCALGGGVSQITNGHSGPSHTLAGGRLP